jgi:hypothetical protein
MNKKESPVGATLWLLHFKAGAKSGSTRLYAQGIRTAEENLKIRDSYHSHFLLKIKYKTNNNSSSARIVKKANPLIL